jgi:outer membrane protein OmpA-like peptidoglycan-associated protein
MTVLAVAALMNLLAAQAAKAQQVPLGATAHFVYFSTDSHTLTSQEQDRLRDVAAMIQNSPGVIGTIIGKADTIGSADYNEHLSQQRAQAVFEALVYTDKVPANRLRLCWTGEHLPFISTTDQVAESQNRMVALIVSDTASAHCGG